MLNPSTATEEVLDPTVRRCLGYAIDWGYNKLHVVNLFGLRSTDPDQLYTSDDPVGVDNDKYIRSEVAGADLVIAAWGSHGTYMDRGDIVIAMVTKIKDIHYLHLTKDGIPGHPLYLNRKLTPTLMGGRLK
jgi:hypothetical protein